MLLNFDYLLTSKVLYMNDMFNSCHRLTTIDLSSFNTSKVTGMGNMFSWCYDLETIVVGDGWNTDKVDYSVGMFYSCTKLVGGKGTVWDTSYEDDVTYAHIDGGTDNPGYLCTAINLANTADNTSIISSYDDCKVKATLEGRTLYKDNSWNTICLPFDVDLTDANSPLYGATVKELDTEAGTYEHITGFAGGTLYLNFRDVTTTMSAGTPYIIKWDSGSDIVSPAFLPVSISNTTNPVTSNDGKVTFTGTYAPVNIGSDGDNTKLYLGASNTLFYPDGEMVIGCQRAFFCLNDITAGDLSGQARAIVLNFGDNEVSGIVSLPLGKRSNAVRGWYDLSGRKMSSEPTEKGVYVYNGKKVIK